jgi:hypothetical protein
MLLALALAGTVGLAAQEVEPKEDVAAVLEELNQRSATIGAFKARYETKGGESDDKTIEFEYLPQDRLHLVVSSPSGRVLESWVDGARIWFIGASEQGEMWGELDWAEPGVELPDWHELLEERFPLKGEWAAYHPMMLLTWSLNEETDKVDFQCSVGCERGPGAVLLGWLRALERDTSLLSLTEDAIVQDHPRFRATVSRRTGFLEELAMVSAEGKTATVRLVALELDTGLEASDFLPPARPDSAQDVSVQMMQALLSKELSEPRRTSFRRVVGLLDRREIEWTTSTQDGLKEVLRAVHEPQILKLADSYGAKVRVQFAEFFEGLRGRVSKGEARSALEPEIAQFRGDLVQTLEQGLPALQSRYAPPPEHAGRSEGWAGVLTLEQGVLEELYDEHVKSPLLGDFEAAAESFLRD